MNTICKLMLVGPIALLLWACDGGDAHDHDGETNHTSDTSTDGATESAAERADDSRPDSGAPTRPVNALQNDRGGDESTDAGDAADVVEDEEVDGEDVEVEEYELARLESPEAAVKYWIELMGNADFYGVLFASDPGSTAYEDLGKFAESMEEAREAEDPQKKLIVPLMETMFCDPWIDAEFEEVERSDGRVKYRVTWTNEHEVDVSVNQVDDHVWRVLVTNEMLQPDKEKDLNDLNPPQNGAQDAAGG